MLCGAGANRPRFHADPPAGAWAAYAMTVHKSQGSEFERVLLVLPGEDSPVLARELVYTGLTRASKEVELWSDQAIFATAVQRRVCRRSGLREALWGNAETFS